MHQPQTLIDFIRHQVLKDKAEVSAETKLFSDGLLDSMNILDLIGYVEKHLGRELKDDELRMDNFRTIATILKVFFNES